MDLRRERKGSLKVCEQQEAEFERIEASKKRYGYIIYARVDDHSSYSIIVQGHVINIIFIIY
jgi:hypothetical protein